MNWADDKPLNGEETADSENVTHEEEETAANSCYYDKSKSFFDNLSCDDPRYLTTEPLPPTTPGLPVGLHMFTCIRAVSVELDSPLQDIFLFDTSNTSSPIISYQIIIFRLN